MKTPTQKPDIKNSRKDRSFKARSRFWKQVFVKANVPAQTAGPSGPGTPCGKPPACL